MDSLEEKFKELYEEYKTIKAELDFAFRTRDYKNGEDMGEPGVPPTPERMERKKEIAKDIIEKYEQYYDKLTPSERYYLKKDAGKR